MSGAIPALQPDEDGGPVRPVPCSPEWKATPGSGARWPWRIGALTWAAFLWWALESPPGELPSLTSPLPWLTWAPGDKLGHALVFAATAWWFHRALRDVRRPIRTALSLALLFGLVTELHQLRVPGRTAELTDFLCNGLGCALYGCLARWRRW